MIDIYPLGLILIITIIFLIYWIYSQFVRGNTIEEEEIVSESFEGDHRVVIYRTNLKPGVPDIVMLAKFLFYIYIVIVFFSIWEEATPADIVDEFWDVLLVLCIVLSVTHGIEVLYGYLRIAKKLGGGK